jgi:hypothetical protein
MVACFFLLITLILDREKTIDSVRQNYFFANIGIFLKTHSSENNADFIIFFSTTLSNIFQQPNSIIFSTENEKFHILRHAVAESEN